MNPNNSQEELLEEFESNEKDSIDEFFRQLEEREKDLHISPDDSVVEIEDSNDYGETVGKAVLPEEIVSSGEIVEHSSNDAELKKIERQLSESRKKLGQIEKDRDGLRELMTRRQNDFESYRKRVEREKNELNRNVVGDLVYRMLPVVDNLERALESAVKVAAGKSVEFQDFVGGVGLVNRQLHKILKDLGVEAIDSVGEQFDPHYHEAVAIEKNPNVSPNTVTEEILRGYRLGEKIIRHAMVKVSENTNAVEETVQEEILEFEIERF